MPDRQRKNWKKQKRYVYANAKLKGILKLLGNLYL